MISSEFREKIIEYVESRISLEDLETWLAPQLYSFLSNPSMLDSEIAADIELGLVDISNSVRSEEDLRNLLIEKLGEAAGTQVIYGGSGHNSSGSSSQTLRETVGSAGAALSVQLARSGPGYISF